MARQDDTEVKAVRWIDPSDVPSVKIHPSMRRRIDDAIAEHPEPRIV
jgi:hypothetical protein